MRRAFPLSLVFFLTFMLAMFRQTVTRIAVIGVALAPSISLACSPVPPKVGVLSREVAQKGVMISGVVTQALDTDKGQLLTIRADKVFVGDSDSRDFTIARVLDLSPATVEPVIRAACLSEILFPLGHKFDRLVLLPAWGNARGWRFEIFGSMVTRGKGLELLMTEARRTGRLRETVSD